MGPFVVASIVTFLSTVAENHGALVSSDNWIGKALKQPARLSMSFYLNLVGCSPTYHSDRLRDTCGIQQHEEGSTSC